MSLALSIGENGKALDLYSLNLEMYVGCEVLSKASFKEALELLKVLPKLDIIITSSKNGSEETAILSDQYISDSGKNIPLIVIGKEQKLSSKEYFVYESKEIQGLVKTA